MLAVLHEAGGKPEHLVRLTWYVTDKREYLASLKDIGRAFRELIGDYDIAMSAVQVVALIEDEAKVEIEATAVVPDPTNGSTTRSPRYVYSSISRCSGKSAPGCARTTPV